MVKAAGFELILLETSGIGQGNSAVMEVSDHSIYVMTPNYGAPSQLEKIDMLDYADLVVLNKFERRGAKTHFAMCESRCDETERITRLLLRSCRLWDQCGPFQ